MYEGKCAEVLSFYSKTGRSSGATLVRRPIPLRSESIVYNFDPCTVTLMSVHASEFSNCIELMQPDIKESFRFLFFSFIKGGGGRRLSSSDLSDYSFFFLARFHAPKCTFTILGILSHIF